MYEFVLLTYVYNSNLNYGQMSLTVVGGLLLTFCSVYID